MVELALEGQRFFDIRRWGIAGGSKCAYLWYYVRE